MKRINYSKGYSMVELLVYITLFILISVVVTQSLLFVMKTYANARSFRTLQQNSELVMERLTREIRQSDTISVAGSVFGSSPGTLTITGSDVSNVPYTDVFSVVGGAVQLSVNGVASNLSSGEVSVSNLTFWNITTTGSKAIRVQLTLTTINKPIVTKTFYTTVIMRE
jgi:Tfp pilus assembly protein PilW